MAHIPVINKFQVSIMLHLKTAVHLIVNITIMWHKLFGRLAVTVTTKFKNVSILKYCVSRNFREKIFSRIWLRQTFPECVF